MNVEPTSALDPTVINRKRWRGWLHVRSPGSRVQRRACADVMAAPDEKGPLIESTPSDDMGYVGLFRWNVEPLSWGLEGKNSRICDRSRRIPIACEGRVVRDSMKPLCAWSVAETILFLWAYCITFSSKNIISATFFYKHINMNQSVLRASHCTCVLTVLHCHELWHSPALMRALRCIPILMNDV